MTRLLKVLLVEDNAADAELVLRELRRAEFTVDWQRVDTEAAYRAALETAPELILSDFEMPQFNGLRALGLLQASGRDIPFIIVSGTIGEEMAVEAMKQGAADYLLKDRLARLGSAVIHALEQCRLRREQRQGAEALKNSEEKLRLVTDNARVGLVMVNAARCYTFANNTYADILGLPSADILGLRVADVLASLYEEQISPRLDRAFAGERVAYELTRVTPGETRHYAVSYEPAKMLGGVSLVVVVITEITERKQAEQLLQASEARYHTLFEQAPDGIVIADAQSNYLDANASMCRMLGYARAELTQLNATDVIAATDLPLIAHTLEAINVNFDYRREWQFRRKDGTIFPAEVIISKMPDGNLLGMIRDITELRRSDRQIREQLEELLRWQDVMMGREDRVQALKAEVNALLAAQNQPPRYGPAIPTP